MMGDGDGDDDGDGDGDGGDGMGGYGKNVGSKTCLLLHKKTSRPRVFHE